MLILGIKGYYPQIDCNWPSSLNTRIEASFSFELIAPCGIRALIHLKTFQKHVTEDMEKDWM